MIKYVCGFLLHGDSVLLVEKNHPEWQKWLLNGIGGHIDGDETAEHAMEREFKKETGLDVSGWQLFASERVGDSVADDEQRDGYVVYFYRARMLEDQQRPEVPKANDRGERLRWEYTGIMTGAYVGNLRWLIPLAEDWRELVATVQVGSDIRARPSW